MTQDRTLLDRIQAMDGDAADLPFWEACERGQFLLMRCATCGTHYWPAADCVAHGAAAMTWTPASGRGVVHVHTVMRRGRSDATGQPAPYAVVVIELDEGPLFHSNLVDVPIEDIRAGLRVTVEFTQHRNGMTVPVFRKLQSDDAQRPE